MTTQNKSIIFTPSSSTEVIGYRVRIVATGTTYTEALAYDEVSNEVNANPHIAVNTSGLPTQNPSSAGSYDIHVSGYDSAGNETDPITWTAISFVAAAAASPTADLKAVSHFSIIRQ